MTRVKLLVVLGVLLPFALATTSPASGAAQRPQAREPIETTVVSNGVKLVSSTGQKLYFGIEAESDTFHGEAPSASANIDVSSSTAARLGEQNFNWEWNDIANGDLLYDSTNGTGSFATDTQLGSWGSIDLSIAPKSAGPKSTCDGADQDWTVALSGTVWFNSHSPWGAFGTKQAPLSFSQSGQAEAFFTSKALNDCGAGSSQQRCDGTINWQDPGGFHGGVEGASIGHNGKRGGRLYFFTSRTLDQGNGPDLNDFVFQQIAKPPKVVVTHHGKLTSLHIHAGTHGVITGSATLTGKGRPSVKKHDCAGGTTKEWAASYTPGANPLTVHLAIGGDFTHRSANSGALFSVESH